MVRKRDGSLVPFHRGKVAEAIFRAAQSLGGDDRFLADELAGVVATQLAIRFTAGARGTGVPKRAGGDSRVPTIEDVQDAVERVLIETGHARTAKAYILYRDRRSVARQNRTTAEQETAGMASPVVGELDAEVSPLAAEAIAAAWNAGTRVGTSRDLESGAGRVDDPPDPHTAVPRDASQPAVLGGWSKARIALALVKDDGLGQAEAEDIARTVEARILGSSVAHVSEGLVRALVAAEVFARGGLTRMAEDRTSGIDRRTLDEALAHGLTDRRATNPAAFAEGIGETVLARHVLDRVLPTDAAAAHRAGDLHVYDLGAPLRLSSIALDAPRAIERVLAGDAFTTRSGARRAIAALEDVILRFAPHVGRVLSIEHVNVALAPFLADMEEDVLSESLRHLLLGSVLRWAAGRSVGARGGLLRLELGLSAGVPARFFARPVPAPAAPGRAYGDFEEAAHRVTRALLTEVAALMHEGHDLGVGLALILERRPKAAAGSGDRDPHRRALESDALRTAALVGEPLVVLDSPGQPSRGSSWHRITEREAGDPLRFDRGDVSAAGVTAINLVGPALRTRATGVSDFLREADRLVQVALDAAKARSTLLFQAAEDPGGTLYGLSRGHHPLVDLEGAHHLIELVGLDQAVVLLARRGGARARQALRQRLVLHLGRRVSHEAAARRLCASIVEGVSDEAAARFGRIDRSRFAETARWWAEGESPSYARVLASGVRREGAGLDLFGDADRGAERARVRVRHRIDREEAVPLDQLRSPFEDALRDPTVIQYRLEPWPRRHVRMVRGPSGEGA